MFRFRFFISVVLIISSFININSQTNIHSEKKIFFNGKSYYLYKVKKSEGFYRISVKFGVSQKEIVDANPSVVSGLKEGDIIKIPVIKKRISNQPNQYFIYHTVEPGETLYYLARKYDVTIEQIKKNNAGIKLNLVIGSILKIPAVKKNKPQVKKDENYVYHEIKPKETLYGLSKRFNISVDSLLNFNPALRSGILKAGTNIRIPVVINNDIKSIKKDTVLIEGDNNYKYHYVQHGETLFSISKKYRVPVRVLKEANSEMVPDNLPLGYVVKIPKNELKVRNNFINLSPVDYTIYSVKRKETIFSIARKFNVEVFDIRELNKDLRMSRLKRGKKIKIPTPEYLAKKYAPKKENVNTTIVNKNNELVYKLNDTLMYNCKDYDYFKNLEPIKVAILMPFDLDTVAKANIISTMEGDEIIEAERENKIIPNVSRTFFEFYEGALLAVDSIRKQGVNIELTVCDISPDSQKVKSVLADEKLKNMDFIIGPAHAENLDLVADFAVENQIKLIYPLSSVNHLLNKNPFIFQVNPNDTLLIDDYAKYLINIADTNRVIIIKNEDISPSEVNLSQVLKDKLYIHYMSQNMIPDFYEVPFVSKDIQSLSSVLSNTKNNIVIIPSFDEAKVSKNLTALYRIIEKQDKKVTLIGFNNWLRFQSLNPEEIHALNTHIITKYCLDYNQNKVNDFTAKYRKYFDTEPFAVSPYFVHSGLKSNYSRYGIWGFDVLYFFLKARVNYGPNFEVCIDDFNKEMIQFNFDFKRIGNWGGFYNNGLFVIQFNPDFVIKRTKL